MSNKNKAAIFILLGQSNAVGHGIPMKEEDKITVPLKNVFGLSRVNNQTFDSDKLLWSGYTSGKMNLGEEQDDTYSVANCLAKLWQNEIDLQNNNLPDLYIVHIAVGAQGVTEKYMWNPNYEKKLIPGKLGTVDISLYSFTMHILSKVKEGILKLGKTPEIIGIHWRGGENDITVSKELLESSLKETYNNIFNGFYSALEETAPTILHKIVCCERCHVLDSSGKALENMHYINKVFDELCEENDNMKIFDVCKCPSFVPDISGNGIFMEDFVHFTPEVNQWVAGEIFDWYKIELSENAGDENNKKF